MSMPMPMSLEDLLKLAHVLAAVWMIAGILGRWVVLAEAARSERIDTVQALVRVAGRFERAMVIPGSFAVLISGLLTAWAQDQPILGFLQGSSVNWLLASLLLYLSSLPIIIWVFLPRGRHFGQALDDAQRQGQVTPALRAAFADRLVRTGHIYELPAIGLIMVLMVGKLI